ncbi:MAG TPA: hypothetical protein VFS52_12615 [Steroidobacteraceae bacterium]|jgi:hypothetical protein|nr:hypothetical protein [Steroidobacteraceae bacterium]
MSSSKTFRDIAILCILSLVCAPSAYAGRIYIDFGDGNFDLSGNAFPVGTSQDVDVAPDQSAGPIALPFSLDFGTGTLYDSFFLNENGAITFGSALPAGVFTSVTSLADLGVPVIAPFYSDLVAAPSDGDVLNIVPGQVFYSLGQADPTPDAGGNYSLADAVPALRITWYDIASATDPTARIFTQLYLYSAGGNDFDIRFSYGNPDFPGGDVTPALDAKIGFVLGSYSASLAAPSPLTGDAFFSFRGGELVDGGSPSPTPVSEPPVGWLVGLGVALLAIGAAWRRRRAPPPRA